MVVNYFFKLCHPDEKALFRSYLERKLPHTEKLFARAGVREIDATLERFAKKKAYKVSLNIKTDYGKFLASEDDHTIAEALDFAKDKLVAQLRRTIDRRKK